MKLLSESSRCVGLGVDSSSSTTAIEASPLELTSFVGDSFHAAWKVFEFSENLHEILKIV